MYTGEEAYFAKHPLYHQQEWVKNGATEFALHFKPLVDSELVFIRGVLQPKYTDNVYEIQDKYLILTSPSAVKEGDWIKIVYAWQ